MAAVRYNAWTIGPSSTIEYQAALRRPRENTELQKWNCPPQGNRRRLAPFKKGPAIRWEVTLSAILVVILLWTGGQKVSKGPACKMNDISDSTSWCGVLPVLYKYIIHMCRDYRGRECLLQCLLSIYSTA